MKLRHKLQNVYYQVRWFLPQRKFLADCGHLTTRVIRVHEPDGNIRYYHCNGEAEICGDCFQKAIIRCAWCGRSIWPGDPVTLYCPKDKANFQKPEYAVFYNEEEMALVGCFRLSCTITGADRAGFWTNDRKVNRVLSPLELCSIKKDAVIVEDLADSSKAIYVDEN